MRENPIENLEKKPLLEWFLAKGIESKIAEEMLLSMKELGYSHSELLDLDQALTLSGRLFLHNVFKEFKKHDLNTALLEPLAKNLAEKEKQSLAHLIWVGPPTTTSSKLSELSGVRSLKNVMRDQKIYFWVLEEYAEFYREKIKEFNLTSVDIISIEDYSKKMQYVFSDGISLLDQLEKLKTMAEEKIQRSESEEDTERKRILRILAIRDRVTIVDYIKPLISFFEGGWVFDADMLFRASIASNSFLSTPAVNTWFFPAHDFWAFCCDRMLEWDSSDYPATLLGKKRFNQLESYHAKTNEIYVAWGDILEEDAAAESLGSLCTRFGETISSAGWTLYTNGSDRSYFQSIDQPNNRYGSDSYKVYSQLERFDALYIQHLSEVTIFKYLNRSYMDNKNIPLCVALLTIQDVSMMRDFIIQKIQLCNFDFGAVHSIKVRSKFSESKIFFQNVCVLDIAAIYRPEIIILVLETLLDVSEQNNKLSSLLLKEAEIPGEVFAKNAAEAVKMTSSTKYTIISLLEKLESVESSDDVKNILTMAKKKIQLTQLALAMESDIEKIKPGNIEIKNMLLDALKEILKTGMMSDASIEKIEHYQSSLKNRSVKLFKASSGKLTATGEGAPEIELHERLSKFLTIAKEVEMLTSKTSADATKRAPH